MQEDAPTKFPVLPSGTISFDQLDKNTQDRFQRNEFLVYSILAIVALSLVTIIIGVSAIVLDQLHFNNQFYKDNKNLPAKVETHTVTKPVFVKPSQK